MPSRFASLRLQLRPKGQSRYCKPLHGLGSGIFEIALPFKGDAFRVVYAVQLAPEVDPGH